MLNDIKTCCTRLSQRNWPPWSGTLPSRCHLHPWSPCQESSPSLPSSSSGQGFLRHAWPGVLVGILTRKPNLWIRLMRFAVVSFSVSSASQVAVSTALPASCLPNPIIGSVSRASSPSLTMKSPSSSLQVPNPTLCLPLPVCTVEWSFKWLLPPPPFFP